MFIIPVGATTISIRETVASRNYLGEFVFDFLGPCVLNVREKDEREEETQINNLTTV